MADTAARTQGTTDNSLKKIVLVSVSYMYIDKLSLRVAEVRLLPEAYSTRHTF